MEQPIDHRLARVESQVRFLTRVVAILLLALCTSFAAFAWQKDNAPKDTTTPADNGRYQVAGSGDGNRMRFVVVDTRTGKALSLGGGLSHEDFMGKTFVELEKKQ